jgi:polyisoprenoid-binding protein YceI
MSPDPSSCRLTSRASPSPFGDQRIAFSAATDVNRDDFGLTWNRTLETGGMLVGEAARIELNVQAIAAADAAVA